MSALIPSDTQRSRLDALVSKIVDLRLWKLAAAHPSLLAAVVALQLLITLSYWVQAYCLALTLGTLAQAIRDQHASDFPLAPVAGVVVCLVFRLIAGLIFEKYASHLGERVRSHLRAELLRAFLHSTRLYDSADRLGARRLALTEGVEGIDAYVSKYIPAALQVWILCPLAIVLMAFLNLPVALVLLLCMAVAVIGPRWWKKTLASRGAAHWDSYEALSSDYMEALRSMPTLRVLGAVGRFRARLQERSDALHRHTVATMRVSLVDTGLTDAGIQLGMFCAAALAARYSVADASTIAVTYLVLLLATESFRPVRDLARHWHAGYLGLSALGTMSQALEGADTSTADAGERGRPVNENDASAGVQLENVSFAYGAGSPVLENASAQFAPGALIALAGVSGSGKSTVFDLVLGLLTPDSGTVRVSGKPVVVSQHSYLFPGTIAQTLRTGAPRATDDQLWHVLERVGLADTVRALPRGLQTTLGEAGRGVSGGQRQRLSIARALLTDAPVLLFDEPTSALDDTNAELICTALAQESKHRTVVMIAHRQEALASADECWVIRNRQLVRDDAPLYEARQAVAETRALRQNSLPVRGVSA